MHPHHFTLTSSPVFVSACSFLISLQAPGWITLFSTINTTPSFREHTHTQTLPQWVAQVLETCAATSTHRPARSDLSLMQNNRPVSQRSSYRYLFCSKGHSVCNCLKTWVLSKTGHTRPEYNGGKKTMLAFVSFVCIFLSNIARNSLGPWRCLHRHSNIIG